MKILAIDGGGIRGYYAAHVLRRIEESFGIKYHEEFDIIAGTSSGSIIAAALASEIPISRVTNLYEKHGFEIFKPSWFSFRGCFRPKYKLEILADLLEKEFGEKTLSDVKVKLIIPSTDIGNGQVHIFKSAYSKDFKRDKHVKVSDAVVASCSAPKYFRPTFIDPYLLADGGVWANNPSLVAVTEAMTRLSCHPKDIKILSVGTGIGRNFYSVKKKNSLWGLCTGWGIRSFIEMLLNLQSVHSQNTVRLLLNKDNLIRINFESDNPLPLDQLDKLPDLKSMADSDFTKFSVQLNKFLGG